MGETIYLDSCATTPLLEAVAHAMHEVRLRGMANPASQHEPGRQARRILEESRVRIAELLGAETRGMTADRLILTSGGTEANTIALRGLAPEPGSRVLISSIEHPSMMATAEQMAASGWKIDTIRVDQNGLLDLDHARHLLADGPQPALVSVMLGNNETGVLQPIRELAELCTEHETLLHTDAVQAVGKIPVNFRELGAMALTFAPHKFHGPLGIGGLLLRDGVAPRAQLFGGFQQGGLRPGTESVELAVGARVALEQWASEGERCSNRIASLRNRLESGILEIEPRAQVIGRQVERLPHVSCLAFEGFDRQSLAMALDLAGIACSTGSACASGSSEPSPVLVAMDLAPELLGGAIRLSLSSLTTEAEIDRAIELIGQVCQGFPTL